MYMCVYVRVYICMYEEREKQLNSTTNVSIPEEISSGLREISRCTIYIQQKT